MNYDRISIEVCPFTIDMRCEYGCDLWAWIMIEYDRLQQKRLVYSEFTVIHRYS